MKWSLIKHDCMKNKTVNLALLLFMIFSASLAVLSVIMAVETFSSISALYKRAQPPHFVQMHKGEIDQAEIIRFMEENTLVTYSQIDTMLDIYGEGITVIGKKGAYDLSDCRLDIGLVMQNESRDILLNSSHEKVILKQGEIGIPVLLQEMYHMEIGDRIILADDTVKKEFIVTVFILDSMMNSSMTSSTRILLADQDFEELEGRFGEKEYLIKAYFNSSKMANDFKTVYEDAALPQNGQAVTYAIIFILSALTDIFMVFVLLMVSTLLIMVSFVCVKFTIMAALEEEVREIGTMKAIGLCFKDISDLYLTKYRVLALVGVVIGYCIALLGSGVVLRHINSTFGTIKISPLTVVLSLFVAFQVFILITYYCKKVLKRISKVTVVDILVSGNGFEKANKPVVRDGLYTSRKLSVNSLMGFREIRYAGKNWAIVFIVVMIAVLMIMVPVNLLNTFESPGFITYMGSSLEDILIEIENGEKLEPNFLRVKKILETDDSIKDYREYRTIRAKAFKSDNTLMNLDIESGEMSGNGLQYLTGTSPVGQNELAVSYLNANELEKKVGDSLLLMLNGQERQFMISGIYQDVTSGGMTAKAKYDFPTLVARKYTFSVNLKVSSEIETKVKEWTLLLGTGVTVDAMEKFIGQTLGGVAKQLKRMVFAIITIGASLAMLITVLFLKLRLAKDLSDVALLRAMGFSRQDIHKQYLMKIGWVSLGGVLAGIFLTEVLDEWIINAALGIAGIGIKRVHLITNPAMEYLLCPLLLMALVLLVTIIVMRTIEYDSIISTIKE